MVRLSAIFVSAMLMVSSSLLSGCGSDDESSGSGERGGQAAPTDFSGRFSGSEVGTQAEDPLSATLTVILTQNGSQVSGNYSNSLGGSGSVSGTAAGNEINALTITDNTGCSYSGAATLNGDQLTGRLSGPATSDCSALDVSFELTRQAPVPSPTPTTTTAPSPRPTATPTPQNVCAGQPEGAVCKEEIESFCPDGEPASARIFTCQNGACVATGFADRICEE